MKQIKKILIVFSVLILVTGCAATPSQNTYMENEAGKARKVEFGKVVDVRPITIKSQNTGGGALVGGLAGAGIGSQIGEGDGNGAAIIVGALGGMVAGAVAENQMGNKEGFDITVTLRDGGTVTVSQYFSETDERIKVGQRVMVQTSGDYMRVLPASHLPESIKRPKKIDVVD
jgi:outer membrane lipoprotein SlyB